MTSDNIYEIRSVAKALDILEFTAQKKRVSLVEIHRELGIPKSTAYELIKTLALRGYLRHVGDSRKYSLGLKIIELGNQAACEVDIRVEAIPVLRELMRKTNYTCHLGVLDGNEGMYLVKVEGKQHIRLDSWEGKRISLHSTGVGKALLAWQDEENINEILNRRLLDPKTEMTITDPNRLREHLAVTKERGWALDDQENEPYIRCIGVPVLDPEGRAIAAISISGLTNQLSDEALPGLSSLAKDAATELSAKLGLTKKV